jgi:chromosome segregation ATPase
MKKLIPALLPLLFLLASCENKEQTARIAQLEAEQFELMREASSRDSLVNSYLETLNEIEANLAEIKIREKIISQETASGNEMQKATREKINEDIRMINELMLKNKKLVASLNQKLKTSNLRVTELEKMIELANNEVAARNIEIENLKTELAGLNFSVAALNDTISRIKSNNQQLATVVTDKTNELNQAYFIVGDRKKLIEKKILNKEGGFLGLGKSQKLSGDVNLDDFTQVDIRSLKSIPLGVKKATLMSVHPAGSYELVKTEKKVEEILIKEPAVFWQKSKVLVIATEN